VLPKTYFIEDHNISLEQIDPDAAFIVRELKEHGHAAYIVGGCVRDLLAKRTPKDFDISTSALPEQIKTIFKRRCLLIGRRFRLAHIRFGKKVFEVSTFRSGENDSDSLIIRDNNWGTEEEDVLRRDFTINGLFYDPENGVVIDFVNGVEDIHKKIIHCIGDPVLRFKQDPVRMIRALKFRARFDFEIEKKSLEAIFECREDILKAAPARLLEEVYRMLESGFSLPFFKLLDEYGFLNLLFPLFNQENGNETKQTLFAYLKLIDLLIRQGSLEKLGRPVLLACMMFPFLEQTIKSQLLSKKIEPKLSDTLQFSYEVVEEFCHLSFIKPSKRHKAALNFLLSMQHRFTPFNKKPVIRSSLIRHEDFKWSLQFLKIRSLLNDQLFDTYFDWKIRRLESFAEDPLPEPEEESWRRHGRRRFSHPAHKG